jgi:hypothetical protein
VIIKALVLFENIDNFKVINMDYKQDSTIECEKKINSLSDEYMFETSDASF